MKKSWVFAFRVEPPEYRVMVRSGASVLDAWFSRVLNQWYAVYPGGVMEAIAEPEFLFVSDEYAREHPRELTTRPQLTRSRKSRKPVQLSLSLPC